MILKEIKLALQGNKLIVKLGLQTSTGTIVARQIDIPELEKTNINDDVSVQDKKIKIIKKNNPNKTVISFLCPDCGRSLTKQNDKTYICTNVYGCPNQRKQLLNNWCKRFNVLSVMPFIDDILNYYSLDSGMIIDRQKKQATELVIPLLYILAKADWIAITKSAQLADKIYCDIRRVCFEFKTEDFFAVVPNTFTPKETKAICKKYPMLKQLWQLWEKDRPTLAKILSTEKITKLYEHISLHKPTFDFLKNNII